MLAILADANIELHVRILVDQCRGPRWRTVWDALGVTVYHFGDLALATSTPDDVLWRLCQSRQIMLVTANRNASGPDSLQETIAREGTVRSLPVITVSDAQRLQRDVTYRERAADAMMELLFDVERVRGAGRVYIP